MSDKDAAEKNKNLESVAFDKVNVDIKSEYFFTAKEGMRGSELSADDDIHLSLLTFCVLVLSNGHTVSGSSNWCGKPQEFDEKMAKFVARAGAIEKTWEIERFLRKQKLSEQ